MEDFRDQFLSSIAVPITVKTVPVGVNVEDSLLSLVAGTAARMLLPCGWVLSCAWVLWALGPL